RCRRRHTFPAGGVQEVKRARLAVNPWRKFRAPTGPSSPAQKHPARGSGPRSVSTTPASWSASPKSRWPRPLQVKSRAASAAAAELDDEVPVRLRDDAGLAARAATLGDDRAKLDAAGKPHAQCAGVGDLVVAHQPVAAGLHGGRGQPADDLELGEVLVDPVEE